MKQRSEECPGKERERENRKERYYNGFFFFDRHVNLDGLPPPQRKKREPRKEQAHVYKPFRFFFTKKNQ